MIIDQLTCYNVITAGYASQGFYKMKRTREGNTEGCSGGGHGTARHGTLSILFGRDVVCVQVLAHELGGLRGAGRGAQARHHRLQAPRQRRGGERPLVQKPSKPDGSRVGCVLSHIRLLGAHSSGRGGRVEVTW